MDGESNLSNPAAPPPMPARSRLSTNIATMETTTTTSNTTTPTSTTPAETSRATSVETDATTREDADLIGLAQPHVMAAFGSRVTSFRSLNALLESTGEMPPLSPDKNTPRNSTVNDDDDPANTAQGNESEDDHFKQYRKATTKIEWHQGSFNTIPVWRHPSFIDLVAEPYITAHYKEPMRFPQGPEGFFGVLNSLEFVTSAVEMICSQTVAGVSATKADTLHAVQSLKMSLQEAMEIGAKLPATTGDNTSFMFALYEIVSKARSLRPNHPLIVPGGWSETAIDPATQKPATRVTGVVLYVVVRVSDTKCRFVVCNTGKGKEHHPQSINTQTVGALRNVCVVLDNIPMERVQDGAFWFFLLRSLVFPSPPGSQDPSVTIYHSLLPFLNEKAIAANLTSPLLPPHSTWRDEPVGPDHSRMRCILEAIHATLVLCGVGESQADRVGVLLHLAMCQRSIQHLNNPPHLDNPNNSNTSKSNTPVNSAETLKVGAEAMQLDLARKMLARRATEHTTAFTPNNNSNNNNSSSNNNNNAETPPTAMEPALTTEDMLAVNQCVAQLRKASSDFWERYYSTPPLELPSDGCVGASCAFELFGRLRRDADIEHLCGDHPLPPILRPVQLTLVSDKVKDFNEVTNAMRHAARLCTLLANQAAVMRNTFALRVSLLQHLFTQVIPIPLPPDHPNASTVCFWRSQPMRYETQADILHLLRSLSRHFAAASFSLRLTRSLDASRILTMGCMAAIADIVMRTSASDIPSPLCLHYSGSADGPVAPFCFEIGSFAVESEVLKFVDPELMCARTLVLDYFTRLRRTVAEDHVIFAFEKSAAVSIGEKMLIDQLCVHQGYDRTQHERLLTGENTQIIDDFPELATFRDIVFMFKLLMAPTSDVLPEVKQWKPMDAALRWKFDPAKGFSVAGFGKDLDACFPRKVKPGIMSRFRSIVGLGKQPRAPKSGADPSTLVDAQIDTEDDVLHVENLPDFDNTLSAQDCEVMLQYLTVPYLRIPLLLQFFNDQARITSLRSVALQEVLEACLFEPGLWQENNTKSAPEMIPAPSRDHLATPAGLLFNELVCAPEEITKALEGLLDKILDLDSGRYGGSSSPTILFFLRVIVRVEGFILAVVRQGIATRGHSPNATRNRVRGLDVSDDKLKILRDGATRIRRQLTDNAMPMLERWLGGALADKQLGPVCVVLAHQALLFRNVAEDALNVTVVSTVMIANIFLNHNYKFDMAATPSTGSVKRTAVVEDVDASLFIPQSEMFDLFQRLRNKVVRWLLAHPAKTDEVMEAIVRVVTMTGRREKAHGVVAPRLSVLVTSGKGGISAGGAGSVAATAAAGVASAGMGQHTLSVGKSAQGAAGGGVAAAVVGMEARHWLCLGGEGRFNPDTDKPQQITVLPGMTYEDWMRATTTQSVQIEINVQLGELTLKKHQLELLDTEVAHMDDMIELFGRPTPDNRIQSAEVKHTTHRKWFSLMGLRHEVQLWDDTAEQVPNIPHRTAVVSKGQVTRSADQWLKDALRPYLSVLPSKLFLVDSLRRPEDSFVLLVGVCTDANNQKTGLKEVLVVRDPVGVHVFDVVEHGRRYYRTLVFTSNSTHCLHDLASPSLVWHDMYAPPHRFTGTPRSTPPKGATLVISRKLTADIGEQTLIPSRLLNGIMPAALLKDYRFWQHEDNSLTGYQIRPSPTAPTMIRVTLVPDGNATKSGAFGFDHAHAIITRIALVPPSSASSGTGNTTPTQQTPTPTPTPATQQTPATTTTTTTTTATTATTPTTPDDTQRHNSVASQEIKPVIDTTKPVLTLLNLLTTPASNTALRQVRSVFTRVENLSHILAWTASPVQNKQDVCHLDVLELPRLGLSFRRGTTRGPTTEPNTNASDEQRLWCVEHDGYFISNTRNPTLRDNLRGLPHALVLENPSTLCLAIVLPATLIQRPDAGGLFSTELVLDRNNTEWISNLRQSRHFFYPVHVSNTFLFTPTFASLLYLMYVRFVSRQHEFVFRMCDACITDSDLQSDERQIFDQLDLLCDDLHPNAHACRVKLSLMTVTSSGGGVGDSSATSSMQPPWNVKSEYLAYVQKHSLVSASCRLTVEEELMVMQLFCGERGWQLENRFNLMCALMPRKNTLDFDVQAELPQTPMPPAFDDHADASCLDAALTETWWAEFDLQMYTSPKPASGEQATQFIQDLFKSAPGFRKSGRNFLILYELMTGSLELRILPSDSTYILGCLLLRSMPSGDTTPRSRMMSMLKTLCYNRSFAESNLLPNYARHMEEAQKNNSGYFAKIGKYLTGDDATSVFMREVTTTIQKHRDNFRKWHVHPRFEPDTMCSIPHSERYQLLQRWLIVPRVFVFSEKHLVVRPVSVPTTASSTQQAAASGGATPLQVSSTDLEVFGSRVYAHIGLDQFVVWKSRSAKKLQPVADTMPFSIANHRHAQGHVAKQMLDRLAKDIKFFADSENAKTTPELLELSQDTIDDMCRKMDPAAVDRAVGFMKRLTKSLLDLQSRDSSFVAVAVRQARILANSWTAQTQPQPGNASVPEISFILGQEAGNESRLTFELLVALLVCRNGFDKLRLLNPNLTEEQAHTVRSITAAVLLTSVRVSLTAECMLLAQAVLQLLGTVLHAAKTNTAIPQGVQQNLVVQAHKLAHMLALERHYTKLTQVERPGAPPSLQLECDPRFLVFEFTTSVLLRKPQVELVNKFVASIQRGESMCHQLIMGAGKTTVIAPLLALLLGDGETLVTEVVPNQLLEFSRAIVRERFSSIITKPVYTFSFDRQTEVTTRLFHKLCDAQNKCGVVIATPTSIKSFAIKFIEIMHALDYAKLEETEKTDDRRRFTLSRLFWGRNKDHNGYMDTLRQQAQICVDILKMFQQGTLILDEVDLILHPLKAELNWPLGDKEPLDFTRSRIGTGLRWQVPFHLLDAILYFSEGRVTDMLQDTRHTRHSIKKLKEALEEGAKDRSIQIIPHVVLLSMTFYHSKLKPLLAHWMLGFLMYKGLKGVSEEVITAFLLSGRQAGAAAKEVMEKLSDDHIRLLNLCHEWLESFLPHVLAKVDRVNFGLLSAEEIARLKEEEGSVPMSRRLNAVPFVGKDVPSRASEFAHPDIVIGLTTLAYRYEGLRLSDFQRVLKSLKDEMANEYGPHHKRRTCKMWVRWVELAGGRVQGTRRRRPTEDAGADDDTTQEDNPATTDQATSPLVDVPQTVSDEYNGIQPLHLVDMHDSVQVYLLFSLLRRLPQAIRYHLNENVFPETMAFQKMKLSASGQELGGDLLFKNRIGFSGTPSDLIPVEFGSCIYELGDDGNMLQSLTDPNIVSHQLAPAKWSVEYILQLVATTTEPKLNALIDTGALITGMANLEVARYLLAHGLEGMDGVVFLDDLDRKMILMRKDMQVMELAQSGVGPNRRFSFYDQVHTTGMDIPQAPNAAAMLTLGKDMTFRDYAQGAFRMRGIGSGQTIRLLVIPEVEKLISVNMKAAEPKAQPPPQPGQVQTHGAAGALSHDLLGLGDSVSAMFTAAKQPKFSPNKQFLVSVAAWLHINSAKSEHMQWNVLMEQNIASVWRKQSYQSLMRMHPNVGTAKAGPEIVSWINSFRERVDHHVDNVVPTSEADIAADKLTKAIERNKEMLSAAQLGEVTRLYNLLSESRRATAQHGLSENVTDKMRAYGAEQVQEQEQEQEQQQLREQEKEQELEIELEIQQFLKRKYARSDESPVPWPVSCLGSLPSESRFFPFSAFAVRKTLAATTRTKPVKFPQYLLISQNHYKRSWADSFRRLKNVITLMEWVPPQAAKALAGTQGAQALEGMSAAQETRLLTAFKMFDVNNDGKMSFDESKEFLRAVDIDVDLDQAASELFATLGRKRDEPLTFDEIKQAMATHSFYKIDPHRYTVVLCLAEAEHLRGLLHINPNLLASNAGLPESDQARLVLGTCTGLLLGASVPKLDTTTVTPQRRIGVECARFLDAQVDMDQKKVNMLLRCLQDNSCDDRREFFLEVRACRRRRQVAWEQTPLAPLFMTPDEYHLLSTRAIVSRIAASLLQRGLYPLDAFRMFDNNQDGVLNNSELYGGLDWLGVELSASQLMEFVCSLDTDGDGFVSLQEFKKAFEGAFRANDNQHDSLLEAPTADLDSFRSVTITPKQVTIDSNAPTNVSKRQDINSAAAGASASQGQQQQQQQQQIRSDDTTYKSTQDARLSVNPSRVTLDLTRIGMQVVAQNSFEELWTSRGTMAHKKAGLWRMKTHRGKTKANTKRVCVGDFAVEGFGMPSKKTGFFRIQLEDHGVLGIRDSPIIEEIASKCLPHPVRFRQVWSQERGQRPLYAWSPVPPSSDYIAMGMVVSNSQDPPDLTTVHCVPKIWLKETKLKPVLVWDDSGTGGRPGSIWRINNMGLMVVTPGHEPPKGPFFELAVFDRRLSDLPRPVLEETNNGGGGGATEMGASSCV